MKNFGYTYLDYSAQLHRCQGATVVDLTRMWKNFKPKN